MPHKWAVLCVYQNPAYHCKIHIFTAYVSAKIYCFTIVWPLFWCNFLPPQESKCATTLQFINVSLVKAKVIMHSVCHDPAFTLHVYLCKRAFRGCKIHKNVQSMRIKDATRDPKFISYVISLSLNKSDRCLNPRLVGCPELTKCYIHFYPQATEKGRGSKPTREKGPLINTCVLWFFLLKSSGLLL